MPEIKFGNQHTDSQGIDLRSAKLSGYTRRHIWPRSNNDYEKYWKKFTDDLR